MQDLKKITVFLLFATLMLVKVSALHVYTHQGSETDGMDHCHLCELAIEAQQADFDFSQVDFTPAILDKPVREVQSIYPQITTVTTVPNSLFSRPPPHAMA